MASRRYFQSKISLENLYPYKNKVPRINTTYYLAESLSWYSLERPKHSCTPESAHNRFMATRSSSEKGSVSSIRCITSNTIFPSICNKNNTLIIEKKHSIKYKKKVATYNTNKLKTSAC